MPAPDDPRHVHLKFDETTGSNAADSSGNGWPGTMEGAATFAAGKINNAVSLSGANADRANPRRPRFRNLDRCR